MAYYPKQPQVSYNTAPGNNAAFQNYPGNNDVRNNPGNTSSFQKNPGNTSAFQKSQTIDGIGNNQENAVRNPQRDNTISIRSKSHLKICLYWICAGIGIFFLLPLLIRVILRESEGTKSPEGHIVWKHIWVISRIAYYPKQLQVSYNTASGNNAAFQNYPGNNEVSDNPGNTSAFQNNPGNNEVWNNPVNTSSFQKNSGNNDVRKNPGNTSAFQKNSENNDVRKNPGNTSAFQNNPGNNDVRNNPGNTSAFQNNPGNNGVGNNQGNAVRNPQMNNTISICSKSLLKICVYRTCGGGCILFLLSLLCWLLVHLSFAYQTKTPHKSKYYPLETNKYAADQNNNSTNDNLYSYI